MANSLNQLPPDVPFTQEWLWKEFINFLAYKHLNGLLLPNFTSDPPTTEYRMYFNTTTNHPKYFNGTIWVAL